VTDRSRFMRMGPKRLNFRFWHKADIAAVSVNVRCWGVNGPGSDAVRSLLLTPTRTSGAALQGSPLSRSKNTIALLQISE
jgi:hypothetical protein